MKKQATFLAFLFSILFCAMGPLGAQTKKEEEKRPQFPVVAKFKLLQVSDAQAAKIRKVTTVKGDLEGKVLHESELLTMTGKPSLLHVGGKWPIVFYDSRGEQFQIQYVDTGIKLDITISSDAQEKLSVEIRPETASILDIKSKGELQAYPRTNVFIAEAAFKDLSPAETMIVGRMSGETASRFLKTEGLTASPSNLVYTLRLERI